ncbi:MAG: methyltransferase protein [Actinomycetia bacterium]|nr:methyltransferase protein [Actinomycetes bacterium]
MDSLREGAEMGVLADPGALIDRLGYIADSRWREALYAVPRHLFVPAQGWASPDAIDAGGYRIDREADPQRWWDAVYSDTVIVTQVDDGRGDPSGGTGPFTSSVSAPGIVLLFGELLGVRRHDRILEVGTGSGWTAGLLADLAGPDGRVVSVEIDPELCERARANLDAAGCTGVDVVCADAAASIPEGEPFDRLHVTCGVSEIPWRWIAALRPGGTGVVPWCPPLGIGHQMRLTRTGEAEAVGTIHGTAGFLMMRSQRPEPGAPADFLHHWDDRRIARTRIDPRTVVSTPVTDEWRTYGGDIALTAMAPGVQCDLRPAPGEPGERTLWLRETRTGARRSGSWALVDYVPGAPDYEVCSYGERDLWAEVSEAHLRWCAWGRPARGRFGLTVTPAGQQIWLDTPANVVGREAGGR